MRLQFAFSGPVERNYLYFTHFSSSSRPKYEPFDFQLSNCALAQSVFKRLRWDNINKICIQTNYDKISRRKPTITCIILHRYHFLYQSVVFGAELFKLSKPFFSFLFFFFFFFFFFLLHQNQLSLTFYLILSYLRASLKNVCEWC